MRSRATGCRCRWPPVSWPRSSPAAPRSRLAEDLRLLHRELFVGESPGRVQLAELLELLDRVGRLGQLLQRLRRRLGVLLGRGLLRQVGGCGLALLCPAVRLAARDAVT